MGGLNGYSGEKWMSRKNTPPSYTEPGGPRIVDTHSYRLSPFGPALQFGGGSSVISANSFWMRLADVPSAFEIRGFGFDSFTAAAAAVASPVVDRGAAPAAVASVLVELLLLLLLLAAAAVDAAEPLGRPRGLLLLLLLVPLVAAGVGAAAVLLDPPALEDIVERGRWWWLSREVDVNSRQIRFRGSWIGGYEMKVLEERED